MEKNYFITITGTKYYYGMKPFEIGRIFKLVKEPENEYDSEAIRAELPFIDKVGYVANSTCTVAKGTYSAGRVYDLFKNKAYGQVLFTLNNSAICLLILQEDEKNMDVEIPTGKIIESKAKYEKGKIGFHI